MSKIQISSSNIENKTKATTEIEAFLKSLSEKYTDLSITIDDNTNSELDIHHIENNHYVNIKMKSVQGKLVFTAISNCNESIVVGGVGVNPEGDLKVYSLIDTDKEKGLRHLEFKSAATKIN
jgi:hypothetical protein